MASQADPGSNERLRALQSYLMREFVESLYGLKQILGEAAMRSPRAFEQAVLGEFSPLALASEVVTAVQAGRRSPTAAAFQLVELLGLLGAIELSTSDVEPDRAALSQSRSRAVDAILQLATTAVASAPIREAFSERNFLKYARTALSQSVFARWRAAIGRPDAAVTQETP
jgi:hypothetical protein